MKTLPAGLQSHLDGGETTMVHCWQVTRNDNTVQGFTEHDRDLTFDSVTYKASTGFTATQIESSLGLAVDNLNADGALSDDSISEEDLAAGRYDGAEVKLYWVNFENVAQRILLMRGNIGQVSRGELAFSAELRSMTHVLQQRTGRTYRRYCDADLGDERCRVNLDSPFFSSTGTVDSVVDALSFNVSGLTNDSNGFYSLGKILFSSGDNSGITVPVKNHIIIGSETRIVLWENPPFELTTGITFNIKAGCDKARTTCKNKFNNIVNNRSFPHIPGNDALSIYPREGDPNQQGGSRFE